MPRRPGRGCYRQRQPEQAVEAERDLAVAAPRLGHASAGWDTGCQGRRHDGSRSATSSGQAARDTSMPRCRPKAPKAASICGMAVRWFRSNMRSAVAPECQVGSRARRRGSRHPQGPIELDLRERQGGKWSNRTFVAGAGISAQSAIRRQAPPRSRLWPAWALPARARRTSSPPARPGR